MKTGHSGRCIMRIVGLADGTPTDFDGQYIVEYDPSKVGTHPVTGRPMVFHLVTTPDNRRATRFAPSEVAHLYHAVDTRNPSRADGEPNRPLTAFTVDINPAPEPPSAGWYVDPHDPLYWRWWDGTDWTIHTGARYTPPRASALEDALRQRPGYMERLERDAGDPTRAVQFEDWERPEKA